MKLWLLIILGVLLVSVAIFWPELSRNVRALLGLAGGVIIVIGLAPDRQQNHDPDHRVYQSKS